MSNNGFLKPVLVGGVAAAIDKFYFEERDLSRTLMFASAVASGVYASEYIGPSITPDFPSLNGTMVNGKTLGLRVGEVASSSLFAYTLNRFVLNNDQWSGELPHKLATIAISDIVGTYLFEYINGQPMEYLK